MGVVPGYVLAPHAFTGGNQGGGLIQTDPGIQPIIPSNEGTLGAGVPGTVRLHAAALVLARADSTPTSRRSSRPSSSATPSTPCVTEAVFAQAGNQPLNAQPRPGDEPVRLHRASPTSVPPVELLEGIPPETEKMLFDTFSFGGKQVGKTTAMTDLAEIF